MRSIVIISLIPVLFTPHGFAEESFDGSSSIDPTLDIVPRDVKGIALGDCKLVKINYEISGGDVFTACTKQERLLF